MTKTMSDALITASYQKILLASPDKSATAIINHFKGSAYAMRRQDALEIIKGLKRTNIEVSEFADRNIKSDMSLKSQKRVHKSALKVGRREALATSRRGRRKGVKAGTVKDMRDRTYKNVDAEANYVEFYG